MTAFKYVIDVACPHDFVAHVEDINGNEIFEVTSYQHLLELIEQRHMGSGIDTIGLRQYLVDQYIICDNDILFTEAPMVIG